MMQAKRDEEWEPDPERARAMANAGDMLRTLARNAARKGFENIAAETRAEAKQLEESGGERYTREQIELRNFALEIMNKMGELAKGNYRDNAVDIISSGDTTSDSFLDAKSLSSQKRELVYSLLDMDAPPFLTKDEVKQAKGVGLTARHDRIEHQVSVDSDELNVKVQELRTYQQDGTLASLRLIVSERK